MVSTQRDPATPADRAPIDLDHPDLMDVYERGDRIVQMVRSAGGGIFTIVLLVNGPILGIDSPHFTLSGLGLCALVLASALAALASTRTLGHRPWISWFTITIDVVVLTISGFLLGGAGSIMPAVLLVVIALNGVRLVS